MKSLRPSALGLLLGGFGLLSNGCTVTTSPPPYYDDVYLDAAWTVFGFAPTLSLCAEAGISEVELVVYDNPSTTVVREVVTSYCEDGGFVTGYVLPYGIFYYQWTGYDRAGNATIVSPVTELDVRFDTVAYLDVDFDPPPTTIQINVFWDTDPSGTDTYGTCAAAFVDDYMNFYLSLPGTNPIVDVVTLQAVDCGNTIYVDYEDDGWALTELSYDVSAQGYATDGTYWETLAGDCGPVDITLGVNNVIDCYVTIVP